MEIQYGAICFSSHLSIFETFQYYHFELNHILPKGITLIKVKKFQFPELIKFKPFTVPFVEIVIDRFYRITLWFCYFLINVNQQTFFSGSDFMICFNSLGY